MQAVSFSLYCSFCLSLEVASMEHTFTGRIGSASRLIWPGAKFAQRITGLSAKISRKRKRLAQVTTLMYQLSLAKSLRSTRRSFKLNQAVTLSRVRWSKSLPDILTRNLMMKKQPLVFNRSKSFTKLSRSKKT